MSDCRSYQDELILGIYGEAPVDSCHGEVCPDCAEMKDDWTEVLRLYRSAREVADPPPLVLARPASLAGIAMAACLIILAVLSATEATRVKPAYALTDREIFWALSRIHVGADAVAGRGLGYEQGPFLEGPLEDGIADLNRRIDEVRREMEEWI